MDNQSIDLKAKQMLDNLKTDESETSGKLIQNKMNYKQWLVGSIIQKMLLFLSVCATLLDRIFNLSSHYQKDILKWVYLSNESLAVLLVVGTVLSEIHLFRLKRKILLREIEIDNANFCLNDFSINILNSNIRDEQKFKNEIDKMGLYIKMRSTIQKYLN
jgi:uncharacterized membrane protein YcjF (UPF0283 family)